MSGDFNADARTKALSVTVIIGDQTFSRRCRDHERRQVRDLQTAVERAHFTHDDAAALQAHYEIAAVLLKDADGNPPAIDLLKEHPEIAAAIASEAHTAIRRLQTAAADAMREQQRARMTQQQHRYHLALEAEVRSRRACQIRRRSDIAARHRHARPSRSRCSGGGPRGRPVVSRAGPGGDDPGGGSGGDPPDGEHELDSSLAAPFLAGRDRLLAGPLSRIVALA
jgi:hypothetical protein